MAQENSKQKPFYLTTTLPYVNADPHIGFALEIVHADIICRHERLKGREVFFTTGTDEHGQKIFQKAQETGQDTQAYVDHYAEQFGKLKNLLGLSYDAFIRTTNAGHKLAAQEMWRRSLAKGDIYKKKYKGLYCVGDEMFLKDTDLVDGKCPNHPNMDPVEIEEENYFFRLSAYQDKLLAYLAQDGVILPEWRRDEAIKFVAGGLEDFSISREIARMSWGVPVPDDDSQVMYVWFDALTNYISTLGWPEDTDENFAKFWEGGEVVQVAGKDQVRFQSVMWQAMLMSVDVKATDKVVYHGFITSGGQKMSKSLGNVIEPAALVEEYGTEAVRYFLARHIHPFEDSDFTLERFKDVYNANLANGLGNLAARIMTLAQTHLESPVEAGEVEIPAEYSEAFENFEINKAADVIWERISLLDAQITDTQPFKVIKTNPEEGKELIAALVVELAGITKLLTPFMPATAEAIAEAIKENKKPENLFPRKD
ncbi:MAG: methionyl-tRNA synthetase [Candidatus Adlerbacteria bacterium]|nr:methionyl-tRNA synthetase [Candidatus Adlerbacteria bacterium]